MKLCLGIDTTGRGGNLALANDEAVLAYAQHEEAQGHTEAIFSWIDELLSRADKGLGDLDRVAVVRGPGSFTGLRIGIITAKGLAFARGLRLWSAPTLALLAKEGGERSTLALFSAGSAHVFAAAYLGPREILAPARFSQPELERAIAALDLQLCIAGDPPSRHLAESLTLPLLQTPRLADRLALCAAQEGWPAEPSDATRLVPDYLAPSQAERLHGVDLEERVHRPAPIVEWE